MKFSNKNDDKNYYTLNRLIQKNKTIHFTTWPLSKNNLEDRNKKNQNPNLYSNRVRAKHVIPSQNTLNLLFESITDPDRKSVV